jgi:16S rRNA (cytidine1402-2'-O)-methyltransferase
MGKLYIVPTPIGNLQDMTFRAIDVLKSVDLALAEDTRKSIILFKHYQISTKLQAFHKFNEHKSLQAIIDQLKAGNSIALVSDAGTPGISDPGFLLVREAVNSGIDVITLPGATAFVPALVNSGLPCDKFVFEGFLPQKKGRQKRLTELKTETRTIVFYESPYRIVKTLEQFLEHFGEERRISVSREISKIYEETRRGSANELLEYFKNTPPKGEFVVVVEGFSK